MIVTHTHTSNGPPLEVSAISQSTICEKGGETESSAASAHDRSCHSLTNGAENKKHWRGCGEDSDVADHLCHARTLCTVHRPTAAPDAIIKQMVYMCSFNNTHCT